MPNSHQLDIAVIGSGISGLSAAWLLSQRHRVTLYEADRRLGGHSNTVEAHGVPVDTGFIVFNEQTYPNLTALLRYLDIETRPTTMSFAVSLDEGRFEYSGSGLGGLFAQHKNLISPRFWSMLLDLVRFYRTAPAELGTLNDLSLADYLAKRGYGEAFRDDHLYPMAAAIWSTPALEIGAYPARAFVDFFENHGLLKLTGRPKWRTVNGGSRAYVTRLAREFCGWVELSRSVARVRRIGRGVELTDADGRTERYDHAVIATHADQALALLADPSPEESETLGAFGYTPNEAVLHGDPSLMPQRRSVWSSWNYMSVADAGAAGRRLSVSYWMNRLQGIATEKPVFVTLNPFRDPDPTTVIRREVYSHPRYDQQAIEAQQRLWNLQGVRRTWYCGAYFGAGFHEDGLQSGLAVAEAIGGVRRPWRVAAESGRIGIRDAHDVETRRKAPVR